MNKKLMDDIIRKFTSDGHFKLTNMINTSESFGDMLVEVSYKRDIRIIFTRDKSQCLCDIKLRYNKYNIQDFLKVLEIQDNINFGDFISMMESVKSILLQNDYLINDAIMHMDSLITKLDARQKKWTEKFLKRFQ